MAGGLGDEADEGGRYKDPEEAGEGGVEDGSGDVAAGDGGHCDGGGDGGREGAEVEEAELEIGGEPRSAEGAEGDEEGREEDEGGELDEKMEPPIDEAGAEAFNGEVDAVKEEDGEDAVVGDLVGMEGGG